MRHLRKEDDKDTGEKRMGWLHINGSPGTSLVSPASPCMRRDVHCREKMAKRRVSILARGEKSGNQISAISWRYLCLPT